MRGGRELSANIHQWKSFDVDVVSERNGEKAFHLLVLVGAMSLSSWHVSLNKKKNYGNRQRLLDERLGNHLPRPIWLNPLPTFEQQNIPDLFVLWPHHGHAWTQCKELVSAAMDLIIILPECLFSALPCRKAFEKERTGNWRSQNIYFRNISVLLSIKKKKITPEHHR